MNDENAQQPHSMHKSGGEANEVKLPAVAAAAAPSKTPSRHRVQLPSASQYYFKYMNSSKKSANHGDDSMMVDEDGDRVDVGSLGVGGGDTGTFSKQSMGDTSFLSLAASSSGSEASDLLNKSALSDTTELTASNFVLATTSKQALVQSNHLLNKNAKKKAAQDAKNEAAKDVESAVLETNKPDQNENVAIDTNNNPTAKETVALRRSAETDEPANLDQCASQPDSNQKPMKKPINAAVGLLRGSSPSLRSRVSSSPASLRKFGDDLKKTRLQRQQQREEEAKRRQSVDSEHSIHSMHAQLEALTTDTAFNRQRLPPPFTQPSQLSQKSEKETAVDSLKTITPAVDSSDTASYADMQELADVLGLGDESGVAGLRSKSTISVNRSSIQRLLGPTGTLEDGSVTANHSSIERLLGTTDAENDGVESTVKSTTPDSNMPTSNQQCLLMGRGSIPTAIEFCGEFNGDCSPEGLLSEGRQSILPLPMESPPSHTPTQLDSPLKSGNKQPSSKLSATPQRNSNRQSVDSPARNTRSAKKARANDQQDAPLPVRTSGGIEALKQRDETSDTLNTSLTSDFGPVKEEKKKGSETYPPIQSEETASLGELEAILGLQGNNASLKADMSIESEQPALSIEKASSKDNQGETASIADINEILGTDLRNFKSAPSLMKTNEIMEGETKNADGDHVSTPSEKPTPSKPSPTTPPDVDLLQMSPAGKKLLTPGRDSVQRGTGISMEERQEVRSALDFDTKPMALTPNSRVAPTPTKLAPTPRRVLNPNNPESPARNTRRASKGRVSISSRKHSLEGTGQEETVFQRSQKKRRSFVPSSDSSLAPPDEMEIGPIVASTPSQAFSQRSVAFGSPEAAIYNIGSPSASFTPMLKSEAKTLYPLPDRSTEEHDDEGVESGRREDDKDATVQIESDLNVLVDKITVENMGGSPELSPIAKSKGDTGAYNVPIGLSSVPSNVDMGLSLASSSTSLGISSLACESQEDQTVDLETAMEGLLENTLKQSSPTESTMNESWDGRSQPQNDQLQSENSEIASPAESVEMADIESIASLHSRAEKFRTKFEIPMEAQKLEFSTESTDTKSLHDEIEFGGGGDQGHTVNLEGSMTALLAAAGGVQPNIERNTNKSTNSNDRQDVSIFESSDDSSVLDAPWNQTDTSTRRRKSVATNTFSLDRSDHERIMLNSKVFEEGKSLVQEKSVSFSDTKEFIASMSLPSTLTADHWAFASEEEVLASLTNEEIQKLVATILKKIRQKSDNPAYSLSSDTLVQFGSANQGMDMVVFDKWGQFLQAVCAEVEKNTSAEGRAEMTLFDLIQEDPRFFSQILRRFESDSHGAIIEQSVRGLVMAAKQAVDSEWNTWISSVLESFQGPLTVIHDEFASNVSEIDNALEACDKCHQSILQMNDDQAERARRKSLLRRQAGTTALEEEIALIEAQLSEMDSELQGLEQDEKELEQSTSLLRKALGVATRCNRLRANTLSSQKDFLSLRGMHSWLVGNISEVGMQFTTLGSCPQTCSTWNLGGMTTENISLALTLSAVGSYARSHKKSLYQYKGAIVGFLDVCVQRMARIASETTLRSPSDVGGYIQKYAWFMGRLDLTAKELYVLQRRYRAKLMRTGSETFSLAIDFQSSAGKVAVEFEIDPLYPSLPVDVRLDLIDGHVDLDVLRKSLVKNAKPGFGSLSKACDILHSAMP